MNITDLERRVALRIHRKQDPWSREGGVRLLSGGTRKVSQAIGRLMRKGIVALSREKHSIGEHVLTPEGLTLLGLDPPTLPALKDPSV